MESLLLIAGRNSEFAFLKPTGSPARVRLHFAEQIATPLETHFVFASCSGSITRQLNCLSTECDCIFQIKKRFLCF